MKLVSSGSFVYPRFRDYQVCPDEEGIREKFLSVYKERIEALFFEFLEDETLSRMSEDYPLLSTGIAHTNLSTRTKNCLLCAGIETVGDLVRYSRNDLLLMRNLGKASLEEILGLIRSVGL